MSRLLPSLDRSYRKREDLKSSQEDLWAEFYEYYRKEAEGYDKDFLKKYDEDSNMTLIFIRCVHRSGTHALTHVVGRSVFRHSFCLHHPGQLPAPA